MVKLLKETYKTRDGAEKRCRFENSLARHEFERGYKARHYAYSVVTDSNGAWRVQRETKGN
jgi:hypothetical protein